MRTHREVRADDVPRLCTFPQSAEELYYLFPKATFPLTPEQLQRARSRRAPTRRTTVARRGGGP